MNYKLALLLLLFMSRFAYAQVPEEEDILAAEQLLENTEETTAEEQAELLTEIRNKPLNINHTDRQLLLGTGLFSERQADLILDHIAYTGKIINLYELQIYEEFSASAIDYLRYYFKSSTSGRRSDHSVQTFSRMSRVLHSDNPKHAGNSLRFYHKLTYRQVQGFSFAYAIEKDPGEQFLTRKGFDHQTGFIQYARHKLKVVLGNYGIQWGQSLLIGSTGYSRTGADLFSYQRNSIGIIPYASSREYGYFNGVASTIRFGHLQVESFISRQSIDEGNTGLHRTTTELAKKDKIREQAQGVRLSYSGTTCSFGIQGLHYNRNDVQVKGISFNHRINLFNFTLYGETATDLQALSMIQGLTFIPDRKITITLLFRSYQSTAFPNTSAYSQNTRPENEQGVLLGYEHQFTRKLSLYHSVDTYRFPSGSYYSAGSATGQDLIHRWIFKPSKTDRLDIQIRLKRSEADKLLDELKLKSPTMISKRSLKVSYLTRLNSSLQLRQRLERVYFHNYQHIKNGYTISHDISYHPFNSRISIDTRFAVFHNDFDTRSYFYEKDLPQSFYVAQMQGKGIRNMILIHYKPAKQWKVACKWVNQHELSRGSTNEWKAQLNLML